MNRDDLRQDPTPDPLLRAALTDLEPQPPMAEVDWEALHHSIHDQAALPLARRRRAARWGWARPVIPAAMAAGLALFVFFGIRGPADPLGAFEERPEGFVSAEEALHADISDDEFILLVSGLADADALLLLAVDEGR